MRLTGLRMAAEHQGAWCIPLEVLFASIFGAVLLSPHYPAVAGEPAAIVEEVSDPSSGVQHMDILQEGRVIRLSQNAILTLGYLRSCVRETIVGGKVTVGRNTSRIENGKRQTETVDCDGKPLAEPSRHGAEVAGAAFRKTKTRRRKLPKPNWTLHSTMPVLRLSDPSKQVIIERLDTDGELSIKLTPKGQAVDLSKAGIKLDPGGLYAMSVGTKRYVIKVSPLAIPEAPLLSRLIIM